MNGLAETSLGCEVFAERGGACESMQLVLLERREGALVFARTEGEVTQQAFDAPWHIAAAFVPREHLFALRQLLAGPLNDCEVRLGTLLRILFEDEEVMFTDLLDLMDAAGIPFEFRAFGPNKALFRPGEVAA